MAARKSKAPQEPERSIDDLEVIRKTVEEQTQQRSKALRSFPLPVAAEPCTVFRP